MRPRLIWKSVTSDFPHCTMCSEASKLVMSYVAAVCGKGQEVNKVKEQLLQSNPVLEGMFKAL